MSVNTVNRCLTSCGAKMMRLDAGTDASATLRAPLRFCSVRSTLFTIS
jgi:hypothetical protein